jgi:hypothetical protein
MVCLLQLHLRPLIFRHAGRAALVKELKHQYDSGEAPMLDVESVDVHSVGKESFFLGQLVFFVRTWRAKLRRYFVCTI